MERREGKFHGVMDGCHQMDVADVRLDLLFSFSFSLFMVPCNRFLPFFFIAFAKGHLSFLGEYCPRSCIK